MKSIVISSSSVDEFKKVKNMKSVITRVDELTKCGIFESKEFRLDNLSLLMGKFGKIFGVEFERPESSVCNDISGHSKMLKEGKYNIELFSGDDFDKCYNLPLNINSIGRLKEFITAFNCP